ncbi:MAG TPA: phosphatase PAP2 family protein [Chthoniobacteraceae bacterium]|nr:phosphatase PAP2 family protein [Chthoniobacteraceae bacterium]
MDQKLQYLINEKWTGPVLDLVMVTLSSLDFWMPVLVIVGIWVMVAGRFRARVLLLTLAVTIGLTDGVVVNSLKKTIERPRPRDAQAIRTVTFAKIKPQLLAPFHPLVIKTSKPQNPPRDGRSMPSGHASNNFAVATVIFLFYRRRGWLLYLVAAGVSYSRVYTGAHWPSDILVSIPIGCAMGYACFRMMEALWQRYGSRRAPALFAAHPTLRPQPPSTANASCCKGVLP